MKKIKFTLLALGLSIGVISAQSSGSTTAPAKQTTPKTTAPKATTPKTKSAPAATTGTTTPTQHVKKDGTPDMRYKENKAAAGKGTSKAAKPAATPTATQPTTGK